MDMSGVASDPTVTNLDLSDPKCVQVAEMCTAFYAGENASQAAVPWDSQFEYGHWATYYWIIIVGILFLFQVFNAVKDRRTLSTLASQKPGFVRKMQAVGRMVFYRRLRPNKVSNLLDLSSNFGVLAVILVTLVFLIGMTFIQRPYYREHLGFGSPPIAIRAGLMAFACVPILIALAGKANLVTLLTGISHERLNVLHRWVAWMSFGLSLIHAIPFFIASYRDPGNGGYQRVVKEFYTGWNQADQATGVPPLAILFGLCVLSLPPIRQRFYESFYAAHIVLAITYFGLIFWHAANTLDSWSYLWATLAVWAASWLARVFVKTQPLKVANAWFVGSRATLTVLEGDVTRMDVWPGSEFKWTPGQHCFLRFTSFAPLENHPFTIVSAAPISGDQKPSHLLFLARSHKGFTHKLASYVNSHAEDKAAVNTTVWLDGPYGGMSRPVHSCYDSLILVAGGTGISACLPFALDFIARVNSGSPARLKRCVLVWAIRKEKAMGWITEELKALTAGVAGTKSDQADAKNRKQVNIVIRVHITNEDLDQDSDSKSSNHDTKIVGSKSYEIDPPQSSSQISATEPETAHGRPNMPSVLSEFIRPAERTMVIGCGPDSFRADLANAVAASQSRVLKGECAEIGMHLEVFGW